MMLRYLDLDTYIVKKNNISLLLKLPTVKDTWLLNCTEGSQFNFFNQNFKINNLSKIIIPNLHISSISGLLGLLSTLNLIGRIKPLHIYAPIGIKYYLDLGKKYSKTNFNYMLYIHILNTGLIINQYSCRVYALGHNANYEFFIVQSEQYGTFYLDKAKSIYLLPGPLYGKLKKGSIFLFPDGFVLDGSDFTSTSILGCQVCCLLSLFYKPQFLTAVQKSRLILFR
uniref:Ribonuclease Z n=1 Tax=Dipterosiphonia australica TaxID=2007208 RepID=A0A1Z1MLM1_9FLOR|nr:ribonuclease Z [Dipterosiphonia australica]ARW66752.1 ribonuclease Z [Dipterosiphonia australica]